MHDNISPEEKLLRLIRRGVKKPVKNKQKAQAPYQHPVAKKRQAGIALPFFRIPANRVFLVIFLILGFYLLADFLIANPRRVEEEILTLALLNGEPDIEKEHRTESTHKDSAKKQIKPVVYYLEPVKSRNLFTAEDTKAAGAPSVSFMERISQLRLQGIISGANPQAAIEDIKTKQVYFLSPGEYIGEVELKEIFYGKVRLNYHGQEADLAL